MKRKTNERSRDIKMSDDQKEGAKKRKVLEMKRAYQADSKS